MSEERPYPPDHEIVTCSNCFAQSTWGEAVNWSRRWFHNQRGVAAVPVYFCSKDACARVFKNPRPLARIAAGEEALTQADLEALCASWQKRLHLQDWDVEVRVKRVREMTRETAGAECDWLIARRHAFITLRDPLDYDPECHALHDPELFLVHALLHLFWAPLDDRIKDDSPQWVAMEQAIHSISAALVALDRERREKKVEDG